jgi:manganese-transporting P-type ATPase
MYKILSLNSLISAYTMSALYLDGVKMGDYQATFLGLGVSVLFMKLSFTKPLKTLYKERPPNSIFHWSLIISVTVQFIAHFSVLLYFCQMCEPYMDRANDESLGTDSEFKPNLKNSIMFIYQWWLQTTVIFVNYSGRPFMMSISENTTLKRMIGFMFLMATLITFNVSDELREGLELVPFPTEEFQQTIIKCLLADLAVCWGIEQTCRYFYLKQFQ